MPARYWSGPLAFVVLGAMLLASWSWILWHAASERQHYATTAQHYSERAEQDATAELQDCFRQRAGVYQCIESVVSAKHDAQRSEYDLAAQQEMAYWTPWIALSGIVTALAAVVGLGALAYQNELAREASFQAQRAWVSYQTWHLHAHGSNGRVDNYLIEIEWKNTGASPALAAKLITRRADDAVFSDLDSEMGKTVGGAALSQGAPFGGEPIVLTPREVIASWDEPIKVRSVIHYKTIFDEETIRVSEILLTIRFVGRHTLEQVQAGNINQSAFIINSIDDNHTMT